MYETSLIYKWRQELAVRQMITQQDIAQHKHILSVRGNQVTNFSLLTEVYSGYTIAQEGHRKYITIHFGHWAVRDDFTITS